MNHITYPLPTTPYLTTPLVSIKALCITIIYITEKSKTYIFSVTDATKSKTEEGAGHRLKKDPFTHQPAAFLDKIIRSNKNVLKCPLKPRAAHLDGLHSPPNMLSSRSYGNLNTRLVIHCKQPGYMHPHAYSDKVWR